jgi:hypothetical protein
VARAARFQCPLDLGAEAISVLRATLASLALGEDTAQRFLQTLIPFFCAQHQYAALRPLLDIPALKAQAGRGAGLDHFLLLPECVAAADFSAGRHGDRALAGGTGLAEHRVRGPGSWDFLRHSERHAVRDEAALALGRALVALLAGGQRSLGTFPRSPSDRCPGVSALMMPAWPADLSGELLEKALRHYALVLRSGTACSRWPDGRGPAGAAACRPARHDPAAALLRPGASGRLERDLELALQQLRSGLNRWHADALAGRT